ncbi:hypothetical protein IKG06_01570 [Candidatus Saccharibacteria bacterium]|nr:hypothetical protein [Candidatus Saccharibacteria bacterium]
MRTREWKITAGPSKEALVEACSTVNDHLNKKAHDFDITASNDESCKEKRQVVFDMIQRETGSAHAFTFSGWGSVVDARINMTHTCRGYYDAQTQTGTYVEFYTI